MSVRELGTAICSSLIKTLKPYGFTRKGARFSRDHAQYCEHFAVSGSRWNSGEAPWEFSVDVGVFFPEIPAREGARGLWRNSHAVGSTNSILAGSPTAFFVTPDNVESVASEVAKIILATSEQLPGIVAPAYQRARDGWASFLPVPASWSVGEECRSNAD